MSGSQVHVIGAGAWGTALAQAAALAGNDVVVHARRDDVAQEICQLHTNQKYLGEQQLSARIDATIDAGRLAAAEIVLVAVPAQTTSATLGALPDDIKRDIPVIVTAKGFEAETLALQSQIVDRCWPHATPLVLSGPSFARDVVAGRPTAVTLASGDAALTSHVAKILSGPTFRLYGSSDPMGVELAGGLKNVYALACGAVEGAGLGLSARSALIARAHAEMTRLIVALGGSAATSVGLAGLGDLALSCTSAQSRNYKYGIGLGRGLDAEALGREGAGLVEGVLTAPVALQIAQKAQIDAPLVEAVNLLIGNKMSIADLVSSLMTRPLKMED